MDFSYLNKTINKGRKERKNSSLKAMEKPAKSKDERIYALLKLCLKYRINNKMLNKKQVREYTNE